MKRHFALCCIALFCVAAAPPVQDERPCGGAEFRQFDFWIGEWNLSWPASETSEGRPGRGTNRVTRVLGGCVILENFSGAPGLALQGMSVSTFNRRTAKWQQAWVDNTGSYLDFVGGFRGGQMVLVRENTDTPTPFLQRMVWKDIQADSLNWSWERSDDGGRTWRVLWPVRYQRKK